MDISPIFIALNLITGLFIGFTIGLTGIGGGVLIQPALIYVLGISPVLAVGTGLLYSVLSRITAVASHWRLGTVRKRRVMFFLYGSFPGVLGAALLVNLLLRRFDPGIINRTLQTAMGGVLFLTALFLAIQMMTGRGGAAEFQPTGTGPFPARKKLFAVCSGLCIGLLIGTTSIGAGVLVIPLLMTFLDCDARQAVGTSNAISLFLSLVGAVVYLYYGNLVLSAALLMSLGSLAGVHFGARLSVRMNERVLRLIVLFLVAISGISLVLKR